MALVGTLGDQNISLQEYSPKTYFGILIEIYCPPKIRVSKRKIRILQVTEKWLRGWLLL